MKYEFGEGIIRLDIAQFAVKEAWDGVFSDTFRSHEKDMAIKQRQKELMREMEESDVTRVALERLFRRMLRNSIAGTARLLTRLDKA